jgi:predicted DNA-binding transcriptional regulator AlpA
MGNDSASNEKYGRVIAEYELTYSDLIMSPQANINDKLPPIVTIKEVCAHFAITRPTLRAWIKRGTFPAPCRPSGRDKGKTFWTSETIRLAFDTKAA